MIDYFTKDELLNFHYQIISSAVRVPLRNNDTIDNKVYKNNELFPTKDIIPIYSENGDKKLLRKLYLEELRMPHIEENMWRNIIEPVFRYHHNYLLIYSVSENVYMEILCEYLKKEFAMNCINLDELFTNGETEVFYLDRPAIKERTLKVKRLAGAAKRGRDEKFADGRRDLIKKFNKQEKIDKLKQLGISVSKLDENRLDELLLEAWEGD